MPSNSLGSPSFLPQIEGSIGKFCHLLVSKFDLLIYKHSSIMPTCLCHSCLSLHFRCMLPCNPSLSVLETWDAINHIRSLRCGALTAQAGSRNGSTSYPSVSKSVCTSSNTTPPPINKPANVFAHNPTWFNFSNCSKHLRP